MSFTDEELNQAMNDLGMNNNNVPSASSGLLSNDEINRAIQQLDLGSSLPLSKMTLEPDQPQQESSLKFGPKTSLFMGNQLEPGSIERQRYEKYGANVGVDPEMMARKAYEGMSYGVGAIPGVGPQLKHVLSGSLMGEEQTPEEKAKMDEYFKLYPHEAVAANIAGVIANPMMVALGEVGALAGKAAGVLSTPIGKALEKAGEGGVREGLAAVKDLWGTSPSLFRQFLTRFAAAGGRVETLAQGMGQMEMAESQDPKRAEEVKHQVRMFGGALEGATAGLEAANAVKNFQFSPEVSRTAERAPQMREARNILKSAQGEAVPTEQVQEYLGPERLQQAGNVAEQTQAAQEQALAPTVQGIESERGALANEFDQKLKTVQDQKDALLNQAKTEASTIGTNAANEKIREPLKALKAEIGNTFGKVSRQMIEENKEVTIDTRPLTDYLEQVAQERGGNAKIKVLADRYARVFENESGVHEMALGDFLDAAGKVPYNEIDKAEAAFARKVRGMSSGVLQDVANGNEATGIQANPALKPLADLYSQYSDTVKTLDPFVKKVKAGAPLSPTSALKYWETPEGIGQRQSIEGVTKENLDKLGNRLGVDSKYKDAFSQVMNDAELTAKQRGNIVNKAQIQGEDLLKAYQEEKSSALSGFDEASKVKLEKASERIKKEIPDFPEGKKLNSLLLRGDLNDLEHAGVMRVIKKTINGKPNPNYDPVVEELFARGRDLQEVNQMGSLWKSLVGAPLTKGISFGPKATTKQFVKQVFSPQVQGTAVLNYPWMEKWVQAANKAKLADNPQFMKVMKGIWPLGLPAKAAMMKIMQDPDRLKKFDEKMSELGGIQ